jgi:hypothetical protein
VETADGTPVEMGPGEASFDGDQDSKPDARGGTGHRSGTVGHQSAVLLIIQLGVLMIQREQDLTAGRPRRSM